MTNQNSAVTSKSAVETLSGLVDRFEKTASLNGRFGARDTEPDGVFQALLVRAFKGRNPTIPHTAEGWELYTSMQGVGLAAHHLWRSAISPVEFINHGRAVWNMYQAEAVEKYLRDYCWRVSW